MKEDLLDKDEIIELYSATTEKPLELTVPRIPMNWKERVLLKLRLISSKRTILIHPITLGGRQRYSIYAEAIGIEDMDMEMNQVTFHNKVAANMEPICMCIASAIHNKKSEPPRWLIETVEAFTDEDLISVLSILRKHINLTSFIASIISITGMSLKPEEMIASDQKGSKTLGDS